MLRIRCDQAQLKHSLESCIESKVQVKTLLLVVNFALILDNIVTKEVEALDDLMDDYEGYDVEDGDLLDSFVLDATTVSLVFFIMTIFHCLLVRLMTRRLYCKKEDLQ